MSHPRDKGLVIERPDPFPETFTLLRDMHVERGTMRDWVRLHELHYKAEGTPIGPRVYRCALADGSLVGVVILSVPKLLLAPRHRVFPKLKPGRDSTLTNKHRAAYINRHFRVNSRTVVDTLYRASGVSYRMLNLAARLSGVRYIEIQSSMSRFNPFALRAGFQFARPVEPKLYERGFAFMSRLLDAHPADHEGVVAEIEAMPPALRERTLRQIRAFYYQHSAMEKTGSNLRAGMANVEGYTTAVLIRHLQQLMFANPMYGVYRNPDAERALPARLPLLDFDAQASDAPLRLDEIPETQESP